MHLVGIQGSDIVDGTKTLVLGLVWQLMRISINQTLASISKNGKGVTDQEMVRWANDTVKKGGKSSAMRSFKDPSLSNAVFFLDLLNGVKPGIVDYSLVNNGSSPEDKRLNGTCFAQRRMSVLMFSQAGNLDCAKNGSFDLPRSRRWVIDRFKEPKLMYRYCRCPPSTGKSFRIHIEHY